VLVTSDFTIRDSLQDSLVTQYVLHQKEASGLVMCHFTPLRPFDKMTLTTGGTTIQTLPNAGGTSVNSEVFSFEVLHAMFGADLEATEMQLEYYPLGSKITDYSVRLHGQVFGVSVTRAMKFAGQFDQADAYRLLDKKLYGVNASTKAVLKRFRWQKQILHVWAENQHTADVLRQVYLTQIPLELQSNTLVLVTVCDRCEYIFYDRLSRQQL